MTPLRRLLALMCLVAFLGSACSHASTGSVLTTVGGIGSMAAGGALLADYNATERNANRVLADTGHSVSVPKAFPVTMLATGAAMTIVGLLWAKHDVDVAETAEAPDLAKATDVPNMESLLPPERAELWRWARGATFEAPPRPEPRLASTSTTSGGRHGRR